MSQKANPTVEERLVSLDYRMERLERVFVSLTTMLIKGGTIIDGGQGFAHMHKHYAEIQQELED